MSVNLFSKERLKVNIMKSYVNERSNEKYIRNEYLNKRKYKRILVEHGFLDGFQGTSLSLSSSWITRDVDFSVTSA